MKDVLIMLHPHLPPWPDDRLTKLRQITTDIREAKWGERRKTNLVRFFILRWTYLEGNGKGRKAYEGLTVRMLE